MSMDDERVFSGKPPIAPWSSGMEQRHGVGDGHVVENNQSDDNRMRRISEYSEEEEEDLIERVPAGMGVVGAMMMNADTGTDTFEIYKSVQTNLRELLTPRGDVRGSTKPGVFSPEVRQRPMALSNRDNVRPSRSSSKQSHSSAPGSSSQSPRNRLKTYTRGMPSVLQSEMQTGSQDDCMLSRLYSREVMLDSDDDSMMSADDELDEDELAALEKVQMFSLYSSENPASGAARALQNYYKNSRQNSRNSESSSKSSGSPHRHEPSVKSTRQARKSGPSDASLGNDSSSTLSRTEHEPHKPSANGEHFLISAKLDAWAMYVTLERHRRKQLSLTMSWISTLVDTYASILAQIVYELQAWHSLLRIKIDSMKDAAASLFLMRERAACAHETLNSSLSSSNGQPNRTAYSKIQERLFLRQASELARKSPTDYRTMVAILKHIEALRKRSDACFVLGESNRPLPQFSLPSVLVDPSKDQSGLTAEASSHDGSDDPEFGDEISMGKPPAYVTESVISTGVSNTPRNFGSVSDDHGFDQFFVRENNLMDSMYLKEMKVALFQFRSAERLELELMDRSLNSLLRESHSLQDSVKSEGHSALERLTRSENTIESLWFSLASQFEVALKGQRRYTEIPQVSAHKLPHAFLAGAVSSSGQTYAQDAEAVDELGARTVKNSSALEDTWLKKFRYQLACDSQGILMHDCILSLRRSIMTAVLDFEERRRPAVLRVVESVAQIDEELESEQALAQGMLVDGIRATKRALNLEAGAFEEEAWAKFLEVMNAEYVSLSNPSLTNLHEHGHTLDEEKTVEQKTRNGEKGSKERRILRAMRLKQHAGVKGMDIDSSMETVGLEPGGRLKLLCSCKVSKQSLISSSSPLGSDFIVKASLLRCLVPTKQQTQLAADFPDDRVVSDALAEPEWMYVLVCLTLDDVIHVFDISDHIVEVVRSKNAALGHFGITSKSSVALSPSRKPTRSTWDMGKKTGDSLIHEVLVDHYALRENESDLPANLLQPRASLARNLCSATAIDEKIFRVREKYTKRGISRLFRKDAVRAFVFEAESARDMREWLGILDNLDIASLATEGLSKAKLEEHDRASQRSSK